MSLHNLKCLTKYGAYSVSKPSKYGYLRQRKSIYSSPNRHPRNLSAFVATAELNARSHLDFRTCADIPARPASWESLGSPIATPYHPTNNCASEPSHLLATHQSLFFGVHTFLTLRQRFYDHKTGAYPLSCALATATAHLQDFVEQETKITCPCSAARHSNNAHTLRTSLTSTLLK